MSESPEPDAGMILAYIMLDGMPSGTTNEERCLRLSTCGFSNSQIAQILQISDGSVRTNLYEARKKLKSVRGDRADRSRS
jgi:DNA-binding CsgD family transcriptional regulator